MYKRCLAVAALAALAACGPEPQQASQNGGNPPDANAATAPANTPSNATDNNLVPLPQVGQASQPQPPAAGAAPPQAAATPAAPQPAPAAPAQAPATAAAAPQQPPPQQPVCQDCGVIAAITPEHRAGKPGMVGTLGGGAAGGLIGNQFGRGSGNIAMTVVGVVGGALAGREVEKRVTSTTVYRITVNMDNGRTHELTRHSPAGLSVGERVHVNGHHLKPA